MDLNNNSSNALRLLLPTMYDMIDIHQANLDVQKAAIKQLNRQINEMNRILDQREEPISE